MACQAVSIGASATRVVHRVASWVQVYAVGLAAPRRCNGVVGAFSRIAGSLLASHKGMVEVGPSPLAEQAAVAVAALLLSPASTFRKLANNALQ